MKEIKSKYKIFRETFSGAINPKREWCILVIVFIFGATILGWASISLYKNLQPDKILEGYNKVTVLEKINLINLDKTILNYEGVLEKFKTLQKIKIVDPSL